MQRFEEVELLGARAQLWRMEIEILREIHRYRFAKRGRRFGSDVELMIVYGAAILYYGFRSRVTLKCRARPCVATWVNWWRSVCLNAQRIKASCLPRNFGRLRLSERCDYFAREPPDYCDYPKTGRVGSRRISPSCRTCCEVSDPPTNQPNRAYRAQPLRLPKTQVTLSLFHEAWSWSV